MNTSEQKILQDFLENPTTHIFDVLDGSMLPDTLKHRKTINFVIKPPTMRTLAKTALILNDLPKDIFNKENLILEDAVDHLDKLVKIYCIISWAKETDYPEWYEPFIMANATPLEIFKLFEEVSIKSQTAFFLTSFKIHSASNPMMMTEYDQEDSTPTGSQGG